MRSRRVAAAALVIVSCIGLTGCARHLGSQTAAASASPPNNVLPSVGPGVSVPPAPPSTPVTSPAATVHPPERTTPATKDALPPPPTAAAPRTPTSADLRAALLTASDAPGFKTAGDQDDPNGSTPGCPALDDDFSSQASATAEVLLEHSGLGPFVRERLRQLSVDNARAAVAAIAGIPHRCPSFTGTVPNLGAVQFTVTALGTPRIGDGTAALRLAMRPEAAIVVYENILIIRRGGTVILIAHTDYNTIDNALTSSCGSDAYAKTERVW